MEKIVVKTAVKTVLIILAVLAVVFAVFNFAFPQHMATLTEGMGNYSLAVKYASLRYNYTGDGDDLARCFDDSVLLGDDKYIVQFGDELIARKDFSLICDKKSGNMGGGYDYRRKVLGKLSVAYYNTGKKAEAVSLAAEANGYTSFAYGNPLMSLAAAVKSEKDAATCALIIAEIEKITLPDTAEGSEQKGFVTEVCASLRAVTANSSAA